MPNFAKIWLELKPQDKRILHEVVSRWGDYEDPSDAVLILQDTENVCAYLQRGIANHTRLIDMAVPKSNNERKLKRNRRVMKCLLTRITKCLISSNTGEISPRRIRK